MKSVLPNLYQSRLDRPFANVVQSAAYFLKRNNGNLLFYSSCHISNAVSFIKKQGGLDWQLVNHRDEASSHCDFVFDCFQAPLLCHPLEKAAIVEKCMVGDTIIEGRLWEDIEAIHTPGHCPGSTCFLWKRSAGNVLFSGDTLYPSHGLWSVAIADGNQETMIQSLRKLEHLKVSYIIPSLFIGESAFEHFESLYQYRVAIQACITRLQQGSRH